MTPMPSNVASNAMGLRRMKFWATFWLVIAALLFITATLLKNYHPLFNFVRAFAEGALIGGLADWFAITALFAHPLGLPIPHTAIIPRRKNEIGLRLGKFIESHFLRPRVVSTKLAEMKITERTLDWLVSEKGSQTLVSQAASLITWALHSLEDEKIRQFLKTHILAKLREVAVAPLLADILHILSVNGKHRELFDKGITIASELFEKYTPRLREQMQEEKSWWVRILQGIAFRRMAKNISRILNEIKNDTKHEAREEFEIFVIKFIENLRTSPELRQKCEDIKESLLRNPVVHTYLERLWSDVKPIVLRHCSDLDSPLRQSIAAWIQATTQALRSETDILLKLERTFRIVVSRSVKKYRHEVAHLITQEVERWDAQTTAQLIEAQIGQDLQWIRINGTVVGGLAGLLIYAISLGFELSSLT